MFAGLVFLGLNLYLSQIVSHVAGMTFNYFMYSRHVFRTSGRNPIGFIGAYMFNYLLGLAFLATMHQFVSSPYVAGFLALLAVSAINYFVLKRIAFPTLPVGR